MCIAVIAGSEKNTTRTFSPFPRTVISFAVRSMSRLRETSSETRNPVENKVSIIAWSRRSCIFFPFIVSNSRFNSFVVMTSISRVPVFANTTAFGESDFLPVVSKYLRNMRRAMR